MFRKLTTVVGLVLLAICAYYLHQANESHKRFEAKVDKLHGDVIAFHENSENQAQAIAASLAEPYYTRSQKNGSLVYGWTKHDALWNHFKVIEEDVKSSPELRNASFEEQREYLAASTPAYVILDLRRAKKEVEDVAAQFYFHGIRSESELDALQVLFNKKKRAMQDTLAKAEKWY